MSNNSDYIEEDEVEKITTYIPGFDLVADGGLPAGRTTLVTGTSGSAKTVFVAQFLAEGIRTGDEHGVFVTFEETPRNICRNLKKFGWHIRQWEAEGKWIFVNAAPDLSSESFVSGSYDLSALMARIEYAIRKVNARRIVLDSFGSIFSQFEDQVVIRREMFRIVMALAEMEVTAVITVERVDEYGAITRRNVEEFVSDNVIILRNVLEQEERRRTLEILKFRGATHQRGEFPFTIVSGEGIVVIPLSAIRLEQRSSDTRITSGSPELDEMCGGGFFRDSIVLVSGATGTGKTLMVTEFMAGGVKNNERCLLFAFEESREQLSRNARGWGVDYEQMEKDGKLKVVCIYPEVMSLEDHLLKMQAATQEFKPNRIAVDSLSALERVSSIKSFREFVIGLTSFIKSQEIAGLVTSTTPTLVGGTSITEAHISTITDTIILLRYVEMYGEMQRGLTVLKMRGSMHDKSIREIVIDNKGMHIGKAFRNVIGILAGLPQHVIDREDSRLGDLFVGDDSV